MKVAILGNSNLKDFGYFYSSLYENHKDITHIFCGGQRPYEYVKALPRFYGVDYYAEKYANQNKLDITISFKDFNQANNFLFQSCDIIIIFWDKKNNQIKNVIEKAKNLNKKVIIYEYAK